MRITTKHGYDFFAVTSAMQKAIRRGDEKIAGYFALELMHSGYYNYVWKRLLIISAEDCAGIITKEIWALKQAFDMAYDIKKRKGGGVCIAKAVILMCRQAKSRDADHLAVLVYLENNIDETDLKTRLDEYDNSEKIELPEYTFDWHTQTGKKAGKTKREFFFSEFEALMPREQGTFDYLLSPGHDLKLTPDKRS